MRTIKAALVATTMSAVALVPAATVVTMVTADAAWANNGNGNGNGGGGGGGGGGSESRGQGQGNKDKGKPSWAGQGKSSNGNSNKGGGIEGFFRKLTGQDKKQAKVAEKPLPKSRATELTGLHPSQLGNMNGALNANINAVLSHIEGGNFNGPVGHMAAVALATVEAEGADETLGTSEGMEYALFFSELEGAGFETFEDYKAAVIADPEKFDADLEAAYFSLGTAELNEALQLAGGYETYQDYVDSGVFDQGVADAYAALGTIDSDAVGAYRDAYDDLSALEDAQTAMTEYWNKNDPATTDDDDALLAGIEASIKENYETIKGTVTSLDQNATLVCEEEPCEPEDGAELAAVE